MTVDERLCGYREAFTLAFSKAIKEMGLENFRRCSWFGHSGDNYRKTRGEKLHPLNVGSP